MATRFNGFGDADLAEVDDAPMLSLFGLAPRAIPTPRLAESADVVRLSRARGRKRRKR